MARGTTARVRADLPPSQQTPERELLDLLREAAPYLARIPELEAAVLAASRPHANWWDTLPRLGAHGHPHEWENFWFPSSNQWHEPFNKRYPSAHCYINLVVLADRFELTLVVDNWHVWKRAVFFEGPAGPVPEQGHP